VSDDLEPLEPREAFEMWLDRQRTEKSEATVQSYYYRVKQFVEWCEDEDRGDIQNLNNLTGRDFFRYDSDRRSDGLTINTIKNQLNTTRLFLEFCVSIEGVPQGVPQKANVPKVSKDARSDDTTLQPDRAKEILENLSRYRYASRDHAMFALAWSTGARVGAMRGLDVGDCYLTEDDLVPLDIDDDEDIQAPFVFFRHRPEEDTPLKNQEAGERPVSLPDEVGEVLQEYIDVRREDITDEYGREPLFPAPKTGSRVTKGALRTRMYILTQPCRFGDCPHGRDPDECKALEHGYESQCPSARSPHPIRSGSITHQRDQGIPPEVVSARVNASAEVIRTHYDRPNHLRRMESRRRHLDKLE